MIKLDRLNTINEMVVIAVPIPTEINHEYQYQVRWIDGPAYYKRKKGEVVWIFTNELDFSKNVKSGNLIDWNDPNEMHPPELNITKTYT